MLRSMIIGNVLAHNILRISRSLASGPRMTTRSLAAHMFIVRCWCYTLMQDPARRVCHSRDLQTSMLWLLAS